jgi:hypothetical protein
MFVRFATADGKTFRAQDAALLVLDELWLVTDRTQADVEAKNSKGVYRAEDLNRVGSVVEYLSNKLKNAGYSVSVSPVTSWTDDAWCTPADAKKYLDNVREMRSVLTLAATTPEVPDGMGRLTYSEANDIEMILKALDKHLSIMLAVVDAGWATGTTHTGFYFKEAY